MASVGAGVVVCSGLVVVLPVLGAERFLTSLRSGLWSGQHGRLGRDAKVLGVGFRDGLVTQTVRIPGGGYRDLENRRFWAGNGIPVVPTGSTTTEIPV